MNMIQRLLDTDSGIGLCWMGNDGWLIGANGHLIAFDLDFISVERLSPPPLPLADVAPALEWLFVTHGHGDHLNVSTCRFLAKHSRCRFLIPENCCDQKAEAEIPDERVLYVQPGMEFSPEPWLKVKTIRAIHGHKQHSVYEYANLLDCGYVVSMSGKTIFQPGDSLLLQQHLELGPVDVLMVSPIEHNTHIEASLAMIESICPGRILAQHFGTYRVEEDNAFWTRGFPDELGQAMSEEDRKKFIIPRQGDLIRI